MEGSDAVVVLAISGGATVAVSCCQLSPFSANLASNKGRWFRKRRENSEKGRREREEKRKNRKKIGLIRG